MVCRAPEQGSLSVLQRGADFQAPEHAKPFSDNKLGINEFGQTQRPERLF
jgi:hypothetical protein